MFYSYDSESELLLLSFSICVFIVMIQYLNFVIHFVQNPNLSIHMIQELNSAVKTMLGRLEELKTCHDLIEKHGHALQVQFMF